MQMELCGGFQTIIVPFIKDNDQACMEFGLKLKTIVIEYGHHIDPNIIFNNNPDSEVMGQ